MWNIWASIAPTMVSTVVIANHENIFLSHDAFVQPYIQLFRQMVVFGRFRGLCISLNGDYLYQHSGYQ